MTLKYFCDRCDTITNDKHYSLQLDSRPKHTFKRYGNSYTPSFDLCPACFKLFEYFMFEQDKK